MTVVDLPIPDLLIQPRPSSVRKSHRSIAIKGFGLITPLGLSADETWSALIDGKYIEDHGRCVIGDTREPRVIELALRAAREAIDGHTRSRDISCNTSDLDTKPTDGNDRAQSSTSASRASLASPRTALIVGTSKGTIESWMPEVTRRAPATLSDVEAGSFGLAEIASRLGRAFNMTGPRLTLSAACASSLHALIRGVMMIRAGEVDRALIVASESSLHPLFLGSFKRLGVFPPAGVGCRPFDESRGGFLMSEAAAAVVLEATDAIDASNTSDDQSSQSVPSRIPNAGDACTTLMATVLIENIALGGDASHLTAADPQATVLKRLLTDVIQHEHVDLIHAHGTGTINNDPAELAAIESVLGETASIALPSLYSHKGALGHSLGSAGLISIVINCLAHQHAIVPPNVRTERSIAKERVSLSRERQEREIRRSVAIAAGFGGACAAVGLVSGWNAIRDV